MPTTDAPPAPARIDPRDPRIVAWRAFLEAHALVARRLDDELRAEHGLSLAEYGALLVLAEAPDRRLRMNQLADHVILSRSGITRLIDRLVAEGLVTRSPCESDRRGAEAALSPAGLARLRAAAVTHLRGIDAYFLEQLSADDIASLERILGGIARRAAGGVEATSIACTVGDGAG
jgi:DNA-binding MarR family transcriptional regulator